MSWLLYLFEYLCWFVVFIDKPFNKSQIYFHSLDANLAKREKSLATSIGGSSIGGRPEKSSSGPGGPGNAAADKEKKIGHRRVDEAGQVSYKKVGSVMILYSKSVNFELSFASADFHVFSLLFYGLEGKTSKRLWKPQNISTCMLFLHSSEHQSITRREGRQYVRKIFKIL